MYSPLTAGDIMTRAVVTTGPNEPLAAAIRLMLDRHVSGLPVLNGAGEIVGILTEGDLLRRVELGTGLPRSSWLDFFRGPGRAAHDYVETHSRIVGDIMTTAVVSVDEAAPLSEVVSVMQGRHVKRVPVLAGSTLVGMVSRVDLLRALAASFAETAGEAACSDASIRTQVLAEFARRSWSPREGLSVTVAHGIVDLAGSIFHEEERTAMRVAAQTIPGVIRVCDHMVWVEPNSGMAFGPDVALGE
jgi:CBS domain-containing protein